MQWGHPGWSSSSHVIRHGQIRQTAAEQYSRLLPVPPVPRSIFSPAMLPDCTQGLKLELEISVVLVATKENIKTAWVHFSTTLYRLKIIL